MREGYITKLAVMIVVTVTLEMKKVTKMMKRKNTDMTRMKKKMDTAGPKDATTAEPEDSLNQHIKPQSRYRHHDQQPLR